jgi:hypothetical protein
MIRGIFTGLAACALMTGAAYAQDRDSTTTTTVTRSTDAAPAEAGPYDRDARAHGRDTAYEGGETSRTVVVHHHPDPGAHALGGGVAGAGLGAAIGCIATIPIGCAPGAAIGAAVGGGTGAIAGAATTPPPSRDVYRRDDY